MLLLMANNNSANEFYAKVLDILLSNAIPFMVGGTFAFTVYTGIERPTKDLDIFCTQEDYPKALKALNNAGYRTELTDWHWLAKAFDDKKHFVDFIFVEANEKRKVDQSWLKNARQSILFGHQVKLMPPEEMLCSKVYVQSREKFDGPDVVHLILKQGKTLNWQLIFDRMQDHWQVLFSHLLMFRFIYPSKKDIIPKWLMEKLLYYTQRDLQIPPSEENISRGLLLSRTFYGIDMAQWGFHDATFHP